MDDGCIDATASNHTGQVIDIEIIINNNTEVLRVYSAITRTKSANASRFTISIKKQRLCIQSSIINTQLSSGSRSHFNHSYSKPKVGQHYEKSDIEMLTEQMGFQCLLERNSRLFVADVMGKRIPLFRSIK